MLLTVIIAVVVGYIVLKPTLNNKPKETSPTKKQFPVEWKIILSKKVLYYSSLTEDEKIRFEYKIQEFLSDCRITGIDTTIDESDKLLVASSAVIPIFGFNDWRYNNIYEVLVYPTAFNEKFETTGAERQILGMVGTGYMEGKMILSKEALHHGFSNETDKRNTAIHEFIHLIDKTDGTIDGIPRLLLEKQYIIPWLDLINKKINEIHVNKSDINPYGSTNQAEFFSVASEYFFEHPQLLEKKHPELYTLLEKAFSQKMTSRYVDKKKLVIGRNSPCPCSSGAKFKKCCGKVHYK